MKISGGMMQKASLVIGLALLSGCATHYAPPTSGPTATVTFGASGIPMGAWVLVQNYASERCEPSPNGTRLATFTTTAVQGKGDPHAGVSRAMPAGQPAVVTFAYQAGAAGFTDTAACTLTQAFVPEAGGKYRVSFVQSGTMCHVSVVREDGGALKPVPGAKAVNPVCVNQING
ncbi:hypothetical protein ACFFGH_34400 [Lysobacter korlensis]|uniref:Lipoprotein n=1 Tax=Lysobacter korlensis TaxID=553636 RepID=A0ABV6S491_9GAMM